LVNIAYGKISLDKQVLPSDYSDLKACEKVFEKIPAHRKTKDVLIALNDARAHVMNKYPKDK
jgi:hypothetical protein